MYNIHNLYYEASMFTSLDSHAFSWDLLCLQLSKYSVLEININHKLFLLQDYAR